MRLQRLADNSGTARWTVQNVDGSSMRAFDPVIRLADLIQPGGLEREVAAAVPFHMSATHRVLAPVDPYTEVWAAGVTYERSLHARIHESETPDIYDRVYAADRPELFAKSIGWRVSGPGQPISVRDDSEWNVPEPELAAVIDPVGAVFGWTICNDVSSRSIEAANPLYLPQAKVYMGGCALGPWILLADEVPDPYALTITLTIERDGSTAWTGTASTDQLRRRVEDLSEALFRADVFPAGVVLATGTSLVPGPEFTLSDGDLVRIAIDGFGELTNPTVRGLVPDVGDRVAAIAGAIR